VSHTLLHQEHRRTKIKAKINRTMRGKGGQHEVVNVSWLAAMSVYFRNIMAFKHVAKPEDVK
jgi:hypothetical protein